jgi:hypothetical protein
MISFDLYFEFLPHWAGPMIINNLKKAAKHFNFNIINFYNYPHIIRIDTDIPMADHYIHTLMEKPLPLNNQEFIDNLKLKIKDNQELILGDNVYKIIKKYAKLGNFLEDIGDYALKVDTSYPKNIFWSNIGNYITPRPLTGMGYKYENNYKILSGHLFPIQDHFQFNMDHLLSHGEKQSLFKEKTKDFDGLVVDDEDKIIHTFYNPYPLFLDFNGHNLPQEIIKSCLKNHNDGYLFNDKAVIFMDFKENKSLDIIKNGYEDTINIRMEETAYYYNHDQSKDMNYWMESLNNIMVFEDKIHMGHKRNTIKNLLKYLLKIQNINYNDEFIEEISWYLLDLNSKIVQEFNDLQGFISSQLLPYKTPAQSVIYQYYKKNYDDLWASNLILAHNIYDSMVILGLGGIMTPHKDPHNLKGVIDEWLKLLIKNKITINIQDVIKIFENDYQEKFFWKNTINAIHSRWILIKKIPNHLNEELIGYGIFEEINYYEKILTMDSFIKRLTGLLKKNNDEINEEPTNDHDEQLLNAIDELYGLNSYKESYYWLLNNKDAITNYLDNNRIKGNVFRENLIKKIIQWKFYG